MPAIYAYEALRSPGSEIRLLELLPGTDKKDIRCRLSVFALSDLPPYEPLSYAWGPRESLTEILVNDKHFLVTPNLAAALRRLRRPNASRILWADAVCINQRDNLEKEAQIGLMSRIYRRGEQTVIWLGEHDRKTARAFEMLDTMAEYVDAVPKNKSTRLNPDQWRFLKKAMKREGGLGMDMPGTISSVFSPTYWASKIRSGHARTSVFGRSWFKRVWVIQEIAVSARAVVVCGRYSTCWTKLEKAYGVSEVWDLWEDGQYLQTLIDMRTSIQAGAREDLGSFMSKVSCFQATESLDRIYAILGLAEKLPRDLEIEIDYTADTSSKFVEATRVCLSLNGSAQLALANRRNPRWLPEGGVDASSSVPSWAWAQQPNPEQPTYQWQFHCAPAVKCQFQAAGRQSRPGEPNVRFSSDGRLLFLHGIVVDEIVEVGPVFGNIQPGYRPRLHGTRFRIGDVQLPRGYSPCLYSSKRVADAVGPGPYPGTNETRRQAWIGFLAGIAMMKDGPAAEERTRALMRYQEALTRPYHILGRGPGELPWSKKTCLRDPEMPRMADSMFTSFELISTLMEFMSKRRVARTSQGYVGLCDRYTEAGDHLALVGGVCVPVVLRPAPEHRWLLIGESYVYGAMHGELWSAERAASLCVE